MGLKVVKSAKHYTAAAQDEIDLLRAVTNADRKRNKPVRGGSNLFRLVFDCVFKEKKGIASV